MSADGRAHTAAPAPTRAGAALRAEAARVLVAVLDDGRSLKAVLAEVLPRWNDPRDRGLIEAIVFMALRHERRYAFVLSRWLSRPLPTGSAKDRAVARLLLVGLAQQDALGLAPHAAVGATVDAVKLLGREGLAGLFNAVLRKATRGAWPVSTSPAIQASHPDWLLARLEADWPGRVEAILAANNAEAPVWLRANAPRVPRERRTRAMTRFLAALLLSLCVTGLAGAEAKSEAKSDAQREAAAQKAGAHGADREAHVTTRVAARV